MTFFLKVHTDVVEQVSGINLLKPKHFSERLAGCLMLDHSTGTDVYRCKLIADLSPDLVNLVHEYSFRSWQWKCFPIRAKTKQSGVLAA